MFRRAFTASLALAILALILSQAPAQAQVVKPFKITGAGTADFIPLAPGLVSPHDAVGTATHLGRYESLGFVRLDAFTGPTTGAFSSAEPAVFTAANGDSLAFDYAGSVELIYVGDGLFMTVWVAEFTPAAEGSTGRFASVVDGSFIMTAVTEPFSLEAPFDVAYSWSGSGWIAFAHGK
jgi:hypothetical protein